QGEQDVPGTNPRAVGRPSGRDAGGHHAFGGVLPEHAVVHQARRSLEDDVVGAEAGEGECYAGDDGALAKTLLRHALRAASSTDHSSEDATRLDCKCCAESTGGWSHRSPISSMPFRRTPNVRSICLDAGYGKPYRDRGPKKSEAFRASLASAQCRARPWT